MALCCSLLGVLTLLSCPAPKTGGDDIPVLEDSIHGYHLGEKMEDLFERAQYKVSWERCPSPRADDRGELYTFSGPLDHSAGIARIRMTFLDERLLEMVVYYKQTNVSMLIGLKSILEKKYSTIATSPDGTVETAYKTYRIKAPGMSVTLRRITKLPENELFVQYQHHLFREKLREYRERSSLPR